MKTTHVQKTFPGMPDAIAQDIAELSEVIWEGCQLCDGDLYLMGALGNMAHYRCRACGATTSQGGGK